MMWVMLLLLGPYQSFQAVHRGSGKREVKFLGQFQGKWKERQKAVGLLCNTTQRFHQKWVKMLSLGFSEGFLIVKSTDCDLFTFNL